MAEHDDEAGAPTTWHRLRTMAKGWRPLLRMYALGLLPALGWLLVMMWMLSKALGY